MGICCKFLIFYDCFFWWEKGLVGIGLGNIIWIELCVDSFDLIMGVGVIVFFVVGDWYGKWIVMGEVECC